MKHSIKKSLKKIGIPTLNLKMEGHTYRFLIDTGSTFNYIASSAFLKLKDEMKVVGETRTSGLNGMAAEQKTSSLFLPTGKYCVFCIVYDSNWNEDSINKKDMKKITFTLFLAALVCSCGPKTAPKLVSSLPSGLEIDALTDCTVPAQFTSDDFRWMGGNLSMKVFSEDLYDAVEVLQLAPGDTLVYGGEKMVVKTVEDKDGLLTINGGLEEGGAWLQAGEGGTYRACQWDDHSLYSELGTAELPLSEDFMIVDCGENPEDPSDTLTTGQKLYLETLEDWRREFHPLNTKVVVEDGIITAIIRRWIP